jgi:uncharacterized protein YdaU (DUF1376 family)
MRAAWWWIDRWRKSTAYICMNAEEQGLYRNLLDAIWLFPDHIIPEDALMNAGGATPSEWERSGPKVLKWMQKVEGGWTNETALEVIQSGDRIHQARSDSGRKGAEKRWQADGKGHGKPPSNDMPPSPSPSPSPISVSVTEEKTFRPKQTGRETWLTPYFEAWKEYYGPNADFQPQVGKAVKHLCPLNDKHGAYCLEQFRAYIGRVDIQFLDWGKFASGFGSWNGTGDDEIPHFDWSAERCQLGCYHEFKKTYLSDHPKRRDRPCPDAAKVSA